MIVIFSVYIFADIQEMRIKRKYIQRENFYVYSIWRIILSFADVPYPYTIEVT